MSIIEESNSKFNASTTYTKNIEKMEDFLNNIKFDIYKRSWSQLENKYKKDRIKLFIETQFVNNNITSNYDELINILYNDNFLKNSKNFKYDKNEGQLISIKNLTFSNSKYILNI